MANDNKRSKHKSIDGWQQLSPKQKRIIKATARNPELSPARLKEQTDIEASESHIYSTKDKYDYVLRQYKELLERDEEEAGQVTEDDYEDEQEPEDEEEEEPVVAPKPHYGPDAQLHRDYESLKPQSKKAVDGLVRADPDFTASEVANEAGVSDTMINYVQDNFPHIIEQRKSTMRRVAADGEGGYNISLGRTDTWKVIRLLPEELSEKIFDQIRKQS